MLKNASLPWSLTESDGIALHTPHIERVLQGVPHTPIHPMVSEKNQHSLHTPNTFLSEKLNHF